MPLNKYALIVYFLDTLVDARMFQLKEDLNRFAGQEKESMQRKGLKMKEAERLNSQTKVLKEVRELKGTDS